MAKSVFVVSFHKVDGKALADGTECFCHQSHLCRQLADGKELADGKVPDSSSVGQKLVGNFLGQVPRFPKLHDVLLRDEGGHPLALRSRSGHSWSAVWGTKGWKLGRWSSSAQEWMSKEEEGMGRKRLNLVPL